MKSLLLSAILTFGWVVLKAQSWTIQTSNAPSNSTFRAVHTGASGHVIAVGAVGTNNKLIQETYDNGQSWGANTNNTIANNRAINDVFVDDQFGFFYLNPEQYRGVPGAVGQTFLGQNYVLNKFHKTGAITVIVGVDAFSSPVVISNGSSNQVGTVVTMGNPNGTTKWNDVFHIAGNTYVVGDNGKINWNNDGLQTTTFNELTTGVSENLKGITFINPSTGFAVGNNGMILKTTNSGSSWTSTVAGTNHLNAVHFVSQTEGWIVGNNGTILHTTNAGQTWESYSSPTTQDLNDVNFKNPFIGYAVGTNGTIIKFQADCTSSSTFSAISCGPYAWTSEQYSTSGTYTRTFPNQFGCDSTVTLNLTVYPAFPITEVGLIGCQSVNYNNVTYTEQGLYLITLTSVLYGCDSLVRLEVGIQQPVSAEYGVMNNGIQVYNGGDIVWMDCNNDFAVIPNIPNPQFFTPQSSGSYAFAISAGNICPADTSDCIQFCVGLNTNVSFVENGLSAMQSGANYQWLDCNNGNSPINGATNQTFLPNASGNYAVQLSLDGCTATSNCNQFTVSNPVNVSENAVNNVLVFPNPASDWLNIQGLKGETKIKVLNVEGKQILEIQTSLTEIQLNTAHWNVGVYILELTNNNSIQQRIRFQRIN